MLQGRADEVARNGVLQRITSARGFLWAPLAFSFRLAGEPSPTLRFSGRSLSSLPQIPKVLPQQ
jgi:hypothetical protein